MEAKITKIGKTKLLQARAGEIALPKIVGFAFGDGGVTTGGIVAPVGEELRKEFFRKQIDNYAINVTENKCAYFCTLNSEEAVGKQISEIGLYDSAGDIIMLANFLPKGKDAGISMRFEIDDIL